MGNQKSIDVLNSLIQINNDRIEGYETASKETEENDLKGIFADFISTSRKCKTELEAEVSNLGGEPTESTKTTGKFFRVWMDVKAALTGKDRLGILNSCEYGEDQAVGTYNKVLRNNEEDLSVPQLTIVRNQHSLIKADHDKVRSMRDALPH